MPSDLNISAINSLTAMNEWMATINGNINGSARTAYKTSKVKFSGAGSNGEIPDSTLITDSTSIDFSQGSIVASTERNHLAIQGPGFFRINDKSDGSGQTYYTRDGEFHFDTAGHLVTSSGAYLTDQLGNEVTVNPADRDDFNLATGHGLNVASVQLVNFNNPQDLEFSSGATVFETTSAPSGFISANNVSYYSLEGSNSSLTQSIPELSLSQKIFSALAKVIMVAQQNTDTVVNLIK